MEKVVDVSSVSCFERKWIQSKMNANTKMDEIRNFCSKKNANVWAPEKLEISNLRYICSRSFSSEYEKKRRRKRIRNKRIKRGINYWVRSIHLSETEFICFCWVLLALILKFGELVGEWNTTMRLSNVEISLWKCRANSIYFIYIGIEILRERER